MFIKFINILITTITVVVYQTQICLYDIDGACVCECMRACMHVCVCLIKFHSIVVNFKAMP